MTGSGNGSRRTTIRGIVDGFGPFKLCFRAFSAAFFCRLAVFLFALIGFIIAHVQHAPDALRAASSLLSLFS